jgi:5'(3')-deoxyribonucleotidase
MPTFYLDMDGVVADWVTRATALIGRRYDDPSEHYTHEEWLKVKGDGRLFRELPLMPRCDELVSIARVYRDRLKWDLLFLTAIPHDNDVPWTFTDKIEWASKHFPDIPVHFGPYSFDKYKHCKRGDILVDDRVDNCSQWTNAGGLAFNVGKTLDTAIEAVRVDLGRRLSMRSMREMNNVGS